MNDRVDSYLESNLGRELDRAVGTPTHVTPRYRAQRTSRRLRLIGLTSIPMALSFRLVTALAAAGLAAGGGTAVLIASHTSANSHGSLTSTAGTNNNPLSVVTSSSGAQASNHGSVVTSAVASCKAARPSPDASPKPSPGSRGIGDCVSIVASGGRSGGNSSSHPTPKPHPTSH